MQRLIQHHYSTPLQHKRRAGTHRGPFFFALYCSEREPPPFFLPLPARACSGEGEGQEQGLV